MFNTNSICQLCELRDCYAVWVFEETSGGTLSIVDFWPKTKIHHSTKSRLWNKINRRRIDKLGVKVAFENIINLRVGNN